MLKKSLTYMYVPKSEMTHVLFIVYEQAFVMVLS